MFLILFCSIYKLKKLKDVSLSKVFMDRIYCVLHIWLIVITTNYSKTPCDFGMNWRLRINSTFAAI